MWDTYIAIIHKTSIISEGAPTVIWSIIHEIIVGIAITRQSINAERSRAFSFE